MQVNNNATDPSKSVDPTKEAQKANAAKTDPNKQAQAAKHTDPAADNERLAQNAKEMNKGMVQPSQNVQSVQDANKVENTKEMVKADQYRRDQERMLKA